MRRKFLHKDFRDSSLEIIGQAAAICEEYDAQGLVITLRQLYYQFVARGLMDNNQKNYKRLGGIVNDARMAGLLDWDWLEDRTRNLKKMPTWSSPSDIVEACASQYRTDKQLSQPTYVEVWVEKEALAGVVAGVCSRLEVPHFACRGYPSASELYSAGRRLAWRMKHTSAEDVMIVHLGDHDPSGIDMTRDIEDRLSTFMEDMSYGLVVNRIALNISQVRKFNPPPNPAKSTDSRFAGYAREYGHKSWELDALDPATLSKMIGDAVLEVRNEASWARCERDEKESRELLRDAAAWVEERSTGA